MSITFTLIDYTFHSYIKESRMKCIAYTHLQRYNTYMYNNYVDSTDVAVPHHKYSCLHSCLLYRDLHSINLRYV